MRAVSKYAVLAFALFALTGCNALKAKPASDSTQSEKVYTEEYKDPNYYYDFDDILVPKELTPVSADMSIFDDETFKAGFRVFEGRVVNEDLINFFVNNMAKDNWEKVAIFKSDKSILMYRKPTKRCTIQIEDGFKTKVTIFAVEYKGAMGGGASLSGQPK